MRRAAAIIAGLAALTAVAAAQDAVRRLTIGDAQRGRELIRARGCVACHVIPGVAGRSGMVGPSLEGVALRVYIAGALPNRPDALVAFLLDPPRYVPTTAMPALGLTTGEAQDIVAYLHLRQR